MGQGDLNLKEFLEKIGWRNNKFYENIKIICSKEVYDIEDWRFRKAGEYKEHYYKDEGHY